MGTLFNSEGLPASSFRTDESIFFTRESDIKFVSEANTDKLFAVITGADANCNIRYTTDGSEPNLKSNLYKEKIPVTTTINIKARVFKDKIPSVYYSEANFTMHKAWKKKVTYVTNYSQQYTGTGNTLTDGIRGTENFKDGLWQGFLGDDIIVYVDLESSQTIENIKLGFLQDNNSWIFAPIYVDIFIAETDNDFKYFSTLSNENNLKKEGAFLKEFKINMEHSKARYIKIVAKNIGLCPEWHPGVGYKAWLFMDEIEIN